MLHKYLDLKASIAKYNATTDALEKLVENNLHTDMAYTDALSCIEYLFVSYESLLRKHGFSWISKDNRKATFQRVRTLICAASVLPCLKSNLELPHTKLCKAFRVFMERAIHLSVAFQLVDTGPQIRTPRTKNQGGSKKRSDNDDSDGNDDSGKSGKHGGKGGSNDKRLPICLRPPHQTGSIRHLLKKCKGGPGQEKMKIFQRIADNERLLRTFEEYSLTKGGTDL